MAKHPDLPVLTSEKFKDKRRVHARKEADDRDLTVRNRKIIVRINVNAPDGAFTSRRDENVTFPDQPAHTFLPNRVAVRSEVRVHVRFRVPVTFRTFRIGMPSRDCSLGRFPLDG